MSVLYATVALVGLVCLFDLVLTLGVVRRLREHAQALADLNGGGAAGSTVIAAGRAAADFAAVTTRGATLSRDRLSGPTLVGFFSTTCGPCRTVAPQFARYVTDSPYPAIAVVVGTPGEVADELIAALDPVAAVVVEEVDGVVGTAFGVTAFPAMVVVEAGGRVQVSGHGLRDLPDPVRA